MPVRSSEGAVEAVVTNEGECSESELVRRAQAGDQEAFRILLERHREEVYARIRAWLPDVVRRKASATDVLQETHLVAYQRLGEFEHRGDNSFRNWLLEIARHKVRDAVRYNVGTAKRTALREVSRPYRRETGRYAASGATPSQVAMGAELEELARQAMSSLPEHYREVLRLARQEQLSLVEVARRMDRPHAATKKLYGRALSRFALELKRLGGITRG